jgi:hypothetical protein
MFIQHGDLLFITAELPDGVVPLQRDPELGVFVFALVGAEGDAYLVTSSRAALFCERGAAGRLFLRIDADAGSVTLDHPLYGSARLPPATYQIDLLQPVRDAGT